MFRRTTLVIGLAISAFGAVARAQVDSTSPVPTPEQQERARRDLAAGQRLLKRERFEAALVKLQASYAVEPTAAALLGVAIAERETDRTPEAYRSYERLLAAPTMALSPEERDRAQRALAEIGAVTGTVKLTLSEPDAATTVDDRPLDVDALAHPLHLSGGRHVFAAAKPGFEPLNFPVYVTVGKLLETSLVLKPQAGAPLPAKPPSAPPLLPPPPAPPAPSSPPAARPAPPLPITAPTPEVPPSVAPPAPVAPPVTVAPPPAAPPPPPPAIVPQPLPPAIPVEPLLPPPSPPPIETQASQPAGTSADAARVGFLLGIVAFPRPVEGELTVKLGPSFALGLKGSYLPEFSVPGINFKLDLKALEGIVRWFPGDGVFFLGAGFGYQNFKASFDEVAAGNQLTIAADMSGFFVQPQLGVLWISQAGFAISFSLGLQIPIPQDPVVTAVYAGQPVPDQATSTVPQDVIDQATSTKDGVQTIARIIVKYPFPTLDLLRIGFFF